MKSMSPVESEVVRVYEIGENMSPVKNGVVRVNEIDEHVTFHERGSEG